MNEQTQEILIILNEECGEVVQAISKIWRFGPDQMCPDNEQTNTTRLAGELGDLLAMIELLIDSDIGITQEMLENAKLHKMEKLKLWSSIFDK